MVESIKNKMQKIDFWVTIIQDSISGIIIGCTIALIGYIIWKKQNLYSKKFEVYINVISAVEEIYLVVSHSFTYGKIEMLDKFYEFDDTLFRELKKNKILFRSFFGKEYNDKIEYFININKHLNRVQITIKDGNDSITHFFKPEEQTPEIINHFRNDVMSQMADYIKDLKTASKNLKGYALLK